MKVSNLWTVFVHQVLFFSLQAGLNLWCFSISGVDFLCCFSISAIDFVWLIEKFKSFMFSFDFYGSI